jgi:hypothetical protein
VNRKFNLVLAAILALIPLVISWGLTTAQSPTVDPAGEPYRERSSESGDEREPDISFIDSPSATCFRPQQNSNTCYVNWNYMYVTASSTQYVISMTLQIDGQNRAYYSGFFQSSMYIPSSMHADGFEVACGPEEEAGFPGFGSAHTYTIRARETGGLKAANYGTVICPPMDIRPVFFPVVQKH